MLRQTLRMVLATVTVSLLIASLAAPAFGEDTLTERQKVLRLLDDMKKSGMSFEIDGRLYNRKRAAELLEARWDHKNIRTAEGFIRVYGTSSKIGDKKYLYKAKMADKVEPLADYLRRRLSVINSRTTTVEDRDFVGESSFKFWPFVYIDKDEEEQQYHFLWPIFEDYSDWKGNTHKRFLPLFSYDENRVKDKWTLDILLGLSSFGRKGYESHAWLFPAFIWNRDRKKESTSLDLVWPLIHYESEGDEYSHFTIRPLINLATDTRGDEDVSEFSILWPLFTSYREKHEVHSHLFPLWIYDYNRVTTESNFQALWPLTGFYSGPDSYSSYVFPLSWWGSSDNRSYYVGPAGLVWYDYNYDTDSSYFHFLPFYLGGSTALKGAETSWGFLPPLLCYWASDAAKDYSRFDILFPLFGHMEEKTFSSTWAIPFFYHGGDSSPQKSYSNTWIFPTIFNSRVKEENTFRVWPFYTAFTRTTPSGETLKSVHDSTLGVLFHYEYDREKEYTHWHALWPLVSSTSTRNGYSGRVLPFAWWSHDRMKDQGHAVVLPLYFSQWEKEYSAHVLFPFYWNYRWGEDSFATHFWPFYGQSEWKDKYGEYSQHSFLYPLFSFTTEKSGSYAFTNILLWLFRYERDDVKNHTWASALWPLYRYDDNPEFFQHTFFPLYSYVHEKEEDETAWWFLWPLMRSETTKQGSDFSILWELFRERETYGKDYALRCNPFFQYSEQYHEEEGALDESFFSLFWILSSYWEQGDEYTFRILLELYKNKYEETRYTHNFHPFWMYSSDSLENTSGMDVLYLLFNYRNDNSENTYAYRFLLRLWLLQQTDDTFRHEFNPLFQYSSGTEDGKEWASFNTLFFLTRYFEHGDDYTFRLLWRLFYLHRNDDYRAVEFHPLFMWSDGKDEGTNFNLLYFLWMSHVGDKELYHYFLGGLFGYEEDEAGSHARLFWFLRL